MGPLDRSSTSGRRPHIEDAQVLSMSALMNAYRSGRYSFLMDIPSPGSGWNVQYVLRLGDMTGEVEMTYGVKINEIWDLVDDTVQLVATLPNLGGRRWWFVCPVTGRRAAKLYLFPGHKYFCCRSGTDRQPTYLSQRVSGAHKVYCRMYNLRRRLPGQGSIMETLRRPRGMHKVTYARLLVRDAEIWNSPQNSLLNWMRKR